MDLRPDVVTVAIERVDGGVTVMRVIVREYAAERNRETGELERVVIREVDPTPEYIDGLIAKRGDSWNERNGKKAVSWELVPNDYVDEQTDRTFRNAWKHGRGKHKPDTDMPKARDIHRNNLRNARASKLEELDVEYLLADETNDGARKRDIAARKKKLRDVTAHPHIEAATTPDELKTLTLEELTKD